MFLRLKGKISSANLKVQLDRLLTINGHTLTRHLCRVYHTKTIQNQRNETIFVSQDYHMNRGLKVSKNPGDMIKDSMVIDPTLTQTEDMDMESQLLKDNVSTVARCPEIPVEGRLSHFLTEWENITSDKWVLELIREGYKLEFMRKPPFRGIKETVVSVCQTVSIAKEIDSLLNKNAIERAQKKDAMKGFTVHFFWFQRKMEKCVL